MAIVAVGIVVAFLILVLMNVGGFISQMVGMLLYNIAVPLMWILDFVQILFRKLAGLGTTYIRRGVIAGSTYEAQTGDILFSLLTSHTVISVFTAMIIVGVIVLIISTIIQMIRTEYTTEGSKNSKTAIIGSALKGLAYFFITPIMCVFGIVVANGLLAAVDIATSYAGSATLSGGVFLAAASDANRVRNDDTSAIYVSLLGKDNHFTPNFDHATAGQFSEKFDNDNFGVQRTGNKEVDRENAATRIDTAFTQGSLVSALDPSGAGSPYVPSVNYEWNNLFWGSTGAFLHLSYDTPAAVMRYYNISGINYLILYVGLAICIVSLFKACFGMIKRMYKATMLFMISPGIIGLWPLDNGAAFGKWRSQFMGSVLAAYGVVVSINLYFDIVGVIDNIYLFSPFDISQGGALYVVLYPLIYIINHVVRALFVIVGALMISEFAATVSSLIGADDAMKEGGDMASKTAGAVGKGAMVAMAGASLAVKAGKGIAGGVKNFGSNVAAGFKNGREAGQNGFASALRGVGKGFAGAGAGIGKGLGKGAVKLGDTFVGAFTGRTAEEVAAERQDRRRAGQLNSHINELSGSIPVQNYMAAEQKRDKLLRQSQQDFESGKITAAQLENRKKRINDNFESSTERLKKNKDVQDLLSSREELAGIADNRETRQVMRRERMAALNDQMGAAGGHFFRQTAMGKALDSMTLSMIPSLGEGKGAEALRKAAIERDPSAKVHYEAIDSYRKAVKDEKFAGAIANAETQVAPINRYAARAENTSFAASAIAASAREQGFNISNESINRMAQSIARAIETSGGKYDPKTVNAEIGKFQGEFTNSSGVSISADDMNSLATSIAESVGKSIEDSLTTQAKKDQDVAGMLKLVGDRIVKELKGLK